MALYLKSEKEKEDSILSSYRPFEKPVLSIVHHFNGGGLDHVGRAVFNHVRTMFFEGETVQIYDDTNTTCLGTATIVKMLSPPHATLLSSLASTTKGRCRRLMPSSCACTSTCLVPLRMCVNTLGCLCL